MFTKLAVIACNEVKQLSEEARMAAVFPSLIQEWFQTHMPTPELNNFKTALAALKRRRPSFGRAESRFFAGELLDLLNELKHSAVTPEEGVKSIAALFEADRVLFEKCDDSNGDIGDVFKADLANAFSLYASQCKNKEAVVDLVLKLNKADSYGVRDSLFDGLAGYLSKAEIQATVDKLWLLSKSSRPDKDNDGYYYDNWLAAIQSIAKQTSNPELFEAASGKAEGKTLSTAASIELAEVFFESGEPSKALAAMAQISTSESYMEEERDRLLIEIYRKLNADRELTETLWRVFRRQRRLETFDALIMIVGKDNKERLVDDETKLIFASPEYETSNAVFLIEVGRAQDAERYVIEKFDDIEGGFYTSLLPLADLMLQENLIVGGSMIYRALLDSLLARAKAANYNHGVRYLKKLDKLAPGIADWKGARPHVEYFAELEKKHKLKAKFWTLYGRH